MLEHIYTYIGVRVGFPGGSYGKDSTYNAGDLGLMPGSGRSPGEGNGYLPGPCEFLPQMNHTHV